MKKQVLSTGCPPFFRVEEIKTGSGAKAKMCRTVFTEQEVRLLRRVLTPAQIKKARLPI